jgi:hypothetical protein
MNRAPHNSQVFDLSNLAATELERTWRHHLRERVPDHLPKSLLSRLLAHRLQEEQHGGLSRKILTYLKAIEADLRECRAPVTPYPEEQKLKAGCQLIREHEGEDHRVTVIAGGYEWNNKTFKSLSAVAKAITGTNWNGHRFFGLKDKARSSVEAAP